MNNLRTYDYDITGEYYPCDDGIFYLKKDVDNISKIKCCRHSLEDYERDGKYRTIEEIRELLR